MEAILIGLSMAFSMAALWLIWYLYQRVNRRFTALMDYISRVESELEKYKAEEQANLEKRLSELLPEYRQAQEAADKVNDFARGLANIFDYDPVGAARRSRKKGGDG